MDFVELTFTAVDTIRASKVRSFLTTLGVVIGVLSVILLVSLGEGARQYLGDTFASIGSNIIQVFPGKRETKGGPAMPIQGTPHRLTIEDEEALTKRAPTLDGVSGVVNGAGTVKFGNRRRDTFIFGVGDRFMELRQLKIDLGRNFTEDDVRSRRRYVILGRRIVEDLFADENPLGKAIKAADAEFRVIGIMEHKGTMMGFDLDDLVMIPETTALDLFGLDGVTNFFIRAKDKADLSAAMDDITDILQRRHGGKVDFTIQSADDLLGTLNAIMATMTLVLGAIASISLIVGGIGIANIMLVSVRERTREIGVRRAVGATRTSILMQFLVESVVIAVLGGLIGLALGGLIIYAARAAVPGLPIQLSGGVVLLAVGFSGLVGVVSGVVPARRAANLDPVEALRYE